MMDQKTMSIENRVGLHGSKRLWTDLSTGNLTKSKDLERSGCIFLGFGYKIPEKLQIPSDNFGPPVLTRSGLS